MRLSIWQVISVENKKIKVMHIISDLNFGGAGKYLLDICKYIDQERFEVVALMPKDSVLVEKIKKLGNIEVHSVNGIDDKSFDIEAVKEIKSLLKDIKPDVVHSHACLSGRVAARVEKVERVFYTRHCIQPKCGFVKKLVKWTISKILSNKVIAVSKAIYDNLVEEGERKEDIYLIYNGVEFPNRDYEVQTIKAEYGLSDEEMLITLVGRLEDVKGQTHMLEISKKLMEKNPRFKTLLVGDGSKRDILEAKVESDKLPVSFLGHIDDIDEIYEVSDIIVNTSNSEALSFAIIEGFSHRKPAVAFDIEGLKEVVDDGLNGYLVEFGDYDAFAEKLNDLMGDESLRERFGDNGFEKVKDKFSVHRMVRELEEIYTEG